VDNQVLLSICILSYNQVDEVERTLKGLIGQITPEVEVFIRDDSTNNDTEMLAAKYQSYFPIKYFHGTKAGIDRTIIYLTQEARGKFVWWMGDDEIVKDGVSQMLDIIRKHEVNFIWANSVMVNTDIYAINLPESGYLNNRDQLLQLGGTGLGFISGTVIKRDLALPHIKGSEKYIGSLFVNLYLVLGVISAPGKLYYAKGPLVICHPHTTEEVISVVVKGKEIKNPAFETFGITFYRVILEFKDYFSHPAIRKTITKSFGRAWRGTVVGTVGGWDNFDNKRLRIIKYFWNFPEAWLAVIVFSTPVCVNRFLYEIYKKIKRSHA
jgi:glycosyltransferase involved in cell wall biosynthesis